MISVYVLFVDDEPDIREIVGLSLGLDSLFVVRGCASGSEALAVAVEWRPDLILLDVMMSAMDGPATLARLRDNPHTAIIPVVFMTARTQARECQHFVSIGAVGVIPKPFDPMILASVVRSYVPIENKLAPAREEFLQRVRSDAAALATCRANLAQDAHSAATLTRIKDIAHALAGASGIYGFAGISSESADLENAAIDDLAGTAAAMVVEHELDRLLVRIGDR